MIEFYVGYIHHELNCGKQFGLYIEESDIVKDMMAYMMEESYLNYLPTNMSDELKQQAYSITTQQEMLDFLRLHSKTWNSFGGSPGWTIKIELMKIYNTCETDEFYAGYVHSECNCGKQFGLYGEESDIVKDIMAYIIETTNTTYLNYLPNDMNDELKQQAYSITTKQEMFNFLSLHSKIWDSYGGSPGWTIEIELMKVK